MRTAVKAIGGACVFIGFIYAYAYVVARLLWRALRGPGAWRETFGPWWWKR